MNIDARETFTGLRYTLIFRKKLQHSLLPGSIFSLVQSFLHFDSLKLAVCTSSSIASTNPEAKIRVFSNTKLSHAGFRKLALMDKIGFKLILYFFLIAALNPGRCATAEETAGWL